MNRLLKLTFIFCVFIAVFSTAVFAQNVTVKGTVYDQTGLPVIGATVKVLEVDNLGTLTDIDGHFTLQNVPANSTLRISFVGMTPQEIPLNGKTKLEVVLKEDTELLDEVVVTALGIKRSEKALSYNVQELKSDDLSSAKDANFLNSLTGKVAGLNINASSTGMGGATKVVMRGTKSIQGSNNALYVIDGVPMFSMTSKQGAGQFDSSGSTESMADINPDNIASISVLTGAAAAALYGSAAANGAILITTKKGQAGAPSVVYSMNMDWGRPLVLPEFQNRYGSGGQITSWGSLMPEGAQGFEVEKFFNVAQNQTHTISVSGGTDTNQTYVSAAVTKSNGLVPNNAYNRYNFSARNSTQLLDNRLTIDFGANYIIQNHRNFVNQGEYMNPLVPAYLMPRSETNANVKNFERYNVSNKTYIQNWVYGNGVFTLQNPYWVAYRNLRETKRERYMLDMNVKFDIYKWNESDKWDIMGRVRTDHTAITSTDKRFSTTTATLSPLKNGYFGELKGVERQTYGDLISTINKGFELGEHRLNINATLGASIQDTRYDDSLVEGPLKNKGIPNVFNIFNIDQEHAKTNLVPSGYIEQTQSIFASAELGWNSYLFLTLTGRNDWASQLANSPHPSFFYPSVGLSILPLEMLNEDAKIRSKKVIDYLQLRTSFASVASPFQRGLTTPTYEMDRDNKIYKTLSYFPVGELFPERTNSFEVGMSSRWLKGLFTLDATYYQTNTFNQTIFTEVPASSGYTGIYIQTGNIRNRGVELALGLHLGKEEGLLYDSNFTFGLNKNEIVDLAENYVNPITNEKESKEYIEVGTIGQTTHFILKKGGTLGDLYTNADFLRDAYGKIVVSKDGTVQKAHFADGERVKLGSVLPDYTFGWSNELTYKGISFGAIISGRVGGIAVSMTQAAMDYYGVSETTASARDQGYVMVDGLTIDPKSYFSIRGKERLAQYYTYDATNIRLQEVHIGYRLARKYIADIADVTLSLYGRNLGFLYNRAPFDPESVSSTGNYSQGIDYFMLPSQRTIGFNLKVNF